MVSDGDEGLSHVIASPGQLDSEHHRPAREELLETFAELEAAAHRVFTLLVRPFGLTADEKSGPNPVVLTLWSTVHGLAALAVDGQIAFKGKDLEAAALATTERVWLGVKDALTGGF